MRYFTSYLKKVMLLRNSRYLLWVTPNTDGHFLCLFASSRLIALCIPQL